ncbi:Biosynthetic peptidoglycan transglycosylase [Paenibacillus solanacearum]|uniref:Biosynthetic peptidoglycan transglycosylase n=1 Tax=Paenibacillus solanacearum TaxID=2048548 RepID=A0A916K6G0_9BACL|nr:PBP1A family penicillin-binding protein [Paenibacillus solanacearum]CAG7645106.1 Biosynthetic peptidoglycan transglycosylase [Paenibacillus solanacearum]
MEMTGARFLDWILRRHQTGGGKPSGAHGAETARGGYAGDERDGSLERGTRSASGTREADAPWRKRSGLDDAGGSWTRMGSEDGRPAGAAQANAAKQAMQASRAAWGKAGATAYPAHSASERSGGRHAGTGAPEQAQADCRADAAAREATAGTASREAPEGRIADTAAAYEAAVGGGLVTPIGGTAEKPMREEAAVGAPRQEQAQAGRRAGATARGAAAGRATGTAAHEAAVGGGSDARMPASGADDAPRPGGRGKQARSWRRPLLGVVVLLIIASAAGLGLGAKWVQALDISKLEHPLPESSLVMDASGKPVSQLSSSKITPVRLDQIPLDLRNAVIAVEDRRFYDHAGFDLLSIGRAIVRDVKTGSLKEGGSTITQQLAKNLFLDSDKTMSRKFKELGYAIKINFTYSKDEILELYLNSIYFGEGRWGVEGAAQQYFGKPVEKLTLPEAAMLAGLPKAPTAYSPYRNHDKALERRNLVLSLMKEQSFISDAAYAQAIATPIELKTNNGESLKGKHPGYVDHVMDEAEKLYGFTEQQILTMGLRIYTSMDEKVQQAAEEVYANDALFPESPADQLLQSGIAIIDHRAGGIRAIVGGRGQQVYRGFNHATELKRQPGSSFKPLAVYGPALERGYTPDSMLYDGDLDIAGYRPKDWDGRTRGQVSMREALKSSWNIPAVWLLNEIGIDTGIDFVGRAGIALPKTDRSLTIALGGLSEGVSPLQMAQAYGAIANEGVLHQARAITKITTKDGHTLVEAAPAAAQLTTPTVAYTLTTLLQDVVAAGSGRVAALSDRPVAGKSGTTQLPATAEFAEIGSGGSKDAWFVGFTPELTAAVWLGYDKTDRKHYLTTSGGAVPAQLFKEVMTRSLKDVPPSAFPVPEEVRQAMEQAQRQAAEQQRNKVGGGNGNHKPSLKDLWPFNKGKKKNDD